LYSSRRIASFSWWSNMSLPSSATKLVIVFIRYLSVATAWKKLVLSSLNLVHLVVYLFFQYSSLYLSNFKICSFKMSLKLYSCKKRGLCSSKASRVSKTEL
jgi:hypothetical protein